LFGINFLLQLAVLLYQSYANPVIWDGRFRIIETDGNRAPCSFGNTIFINPAAYDWETYNQILIHEKTHVSGRHTVDILLAEIAVVLQWFNPIAWWYRREVENNLEFLTDESVLLHEEVERSAYQLSLLRVSAPHLPFSITNNYNQSLLKRRIVMMNSKRSSRHTVWKYFFLLPIFTVLVCVLNKPAVYGQQSKPASGKTGKKAAQAAKADPAAQATPAAAADVATPPNAAKPAEQDTAARPGSASGGSGTSSGAGVSGSNVRGSFNEGFSSDFVIEPIAPISLTATTVTFAPVIAMDARPAMVTRVEPVMAMTLSAEPVVLASPRVSVRTNLSLSGISVDADSYVDDLTEGSWFITTTDGKLWFELKAEEDDHSWSHSMTVEKTEVNPFPGMGNVSFKLVRDAGTMTFTGQFDGQQGFGHFHFQADEAYFKAMAQMGVEELDSHRQIAFFLSNVKKDYASMVVHNGYPHVRARELVSLSAMHIDQEFIQYWRGAGLAETDEPRTLITLKAQNIDKSYLEELKAAGYDHLTARELASLKSQQINGAYVRSMGRRRDNEAIPVRELISYKAMKIDSDYLASLRKLGYTDLEPREVTSLYSMHITADFIKGFQDLGYKEIPVRDLMTLKAMKITPDFVKGFRDIGYEDISPSRLGSLKSMGITPEFVGEFKKIGFDNIPLSMLPSLKSMGVNAEYISKMREKGFVSKDLNKYIRLKNDFN
ncbi:MAG TPA: M56 family metallopeptidase, partial [Puia sp.]|nr:M56 family metallopeptidase [Puia sp.]